MISDCHAFLNEKQSIGTITIIMLVLNTTRSNNNSCVVMTDFYDIKMIFDVVCLLCR